MNAFIRVTDHDWFQLLRSQPYIEGLHSDNQFFKTLKPEELLFFSSIA